MLVIYQGSALVLTFATISVGERWASLMFCVFIYPPPEVLPSLLYEDRSILWRFWCEAWLHLGAHPSAQMPMVPLYEDRMNLWRF